MASSYFDLHKEPAVKYIDELLQDAISKRASDIHLESVVNGLRIRYRVDGLLYDHDSLDSSLSSHIISRLKVLSNIDITEKRIPQDGQFFIPFDQRRIDIRVATFPALHGEKVVMRLFDQGRVALNLASIGMPSSVYEDFVGLIHRLNGFVLVTGPTGSGKTTTLYSALAFLNNEERHIITLEDPIEYDLSGITQGHVNPAVGFTFARGMRALLRQDPDIVMVGEIRDSETAHIALQASLTGHLVFSTVHTNDAPAVIVRLMEMGIEPFLLGAALSGILAQRLVRTICSACRVAYSPDSKEQAQLAMFGFKFEKLYKGSGCQLCNDRGYRGRTGIFELLVIDDGLRALIVDKVSSQLVRKYVIESGMQSLVDDGIDKVRRGCISLQELVRTVL